MCFNEIVCYDDNSKQLVSGKCNNCCFIDPDTVYYNSWLSICLSPHVIKRKRRKSANERKEEREEPVSEVE